MKNLLFLSLFAFSTFVFISCGDDDEMTPTPNLTIMSPPNGTSFAAGSDITIVATITDDVGVTSIDVSSARLNLNETITVPNPQPSNTITIIITLDPSAVADPYKINLIANDADGNSISKDLDIIVI